MLKFSTVSVFITLFLANGTVEVQRSDQSRRGGPFSSRERMEGIVFLISIPEIQQELKLTGEQQKLRDALNTDLLDQRRALFRNGFDDNSSAEDRFEQMRRRSQEFSRQSNELAKTILEPEQTKRLNQLDLQFVGVRAFERDEVVQSIGLTELQRDQIRKIRESTRRSKATNRGKSRGRESSGDFNSIPQAVLAVLTDEQKQHWKKIRGNKFKFPGWMSRVGRAGFRGRSPQPR